MRQHSYDNYSPPSDSGPAYHRPYSDPSDAAYSDGYTSAEYFFWMLLLLFCVFICLQLAAVSYYFDANPPTLPRYSQPIRDSRRQSAPETGPPVYAYDVPHYQHPQYSQ